MQLDTPFQHSATEDEVKALLTNAQLLEDFKNAEMCISAMTFLPYKVVNGIRYDLELVQDVDSRIA